MCFYSNFKSAVKIHRTFLFLSFIKFLSNHRDIFCFYTSFKKLKFFVRNLGIVPSNGHIQSFGLWMIF
jgi:hypothetical protein